jgi:hypothetical protein
LEYVLARRSQLRGVLAETEFLARLVKMGLCSDEKRAALFEWPGWGWDSMPHECWPSVVVRRVNHVKVLWDVDAPVAAKAYLCFCHEWPRATPNSRQ